MPLTQRAVDQLALALLNYLNLNNTSTEDHLQVSAFFNSLKDKLTEQEKIQVITSVDDFVHN